VGGEKAGAGGIAGRGATGRATARPTEDAAERRLAHLRRQRDELATELEGVRGARLEAERRRARAEAAIALAERQLADATRAAADLGEHEGRLTEAALARIAAAAAGERERLRAAEVAASSVRERVRVAQERARLDERDELEARLALEGLREQLLVELAGLGAIGLRHLLAIGGTADAPAAAEAAMRETALSPADAAPPGDADEDLDPEALEHALTRASAVWQDRPPAGVPPAPGRLATLRRRFHDLGAVNPFAADEYAEVRTRLESLDGQRTDLQAAIEHTRDLIRELDRLIADQFRRTFEALERAFDRRFQQLFGGGFARLSLTEPQDLAATGIEITARPPGKKPQALAMLSGGERALTAVALLFAMLEVRPVPFCVLDEVDAALDEANIGRFTDALRDLARETQCIVITHNRGTIETADALYGVTVGEDSVSRVISLRLDEATALAARGTGAGALDDRPAPAPVGTRAGD
jgi:chromosome segregation protein